jgi:hypothetical protein
MRATSATAGPSGAAALIFNNPEVFFAKHQTAFAAAAISAAQLTHLRDGF